MDSNPLRKNRGNLRVKLENGVGTISILSEMLNPVQTYDAIVGGKIKSSFAASRLTSAFHR